MSLPRFLLWVLAEDPRHGGQRHSILSQHSRQRGRHAHTHAHTHTHACIICTCICVCTQAHMHTHMYTCMDICVHTHVYMRTYTHVCLHEVHVCVPLDPASHVGMVERPGEILHMPWVYVTPGSLRLRNLHYCKGGSWQNCPAFAL